MAKKVNESLDFQSDARILNLPAPLAGGEAARKTDVDNAIATLEGLLAGFSIIDLIARVAATANVNIASPGASIDSLALSNGDVVLLTAQTTTTQNGLWVWNGATSALTRATVSGDAIVYQAGSVVIVGPDGSANKNTLWLQGTDSPVVGTTALTFTEFGQVIGAGTGLTLTGTTLSLTTPVTVANGGTNATSAANARSNLGTPGIYGADFGDGAASSFAITHNLNNSYPVVVVYNKSTGAIEDCTVVTNSVNQVTLSAEGWTASPPTAAAYHVTVIG